jgi:hypothetical protein
MMKQIHTWKKTLRRKIRSTALRLLPKFFAHRLIRKSLNLAVPQANSKLSFEIVSNALDLKTALRLVQQNFEREGYALKTTSGLRLTPFHLLPDTIVIVAKENDQIVATISVIPRTSFGIPLDSSFEISSFLADKGKVLEISALAVNPSFRGQHGEVLYNLMKYMYHCNVDLLRANTEVIGVNPKMEPLYEAILLFERIPGTSRSAYNFANGAPVIPMHFSLDRANTLYKTAYNGTPPLLNLMSFFLLPLPPQFALPTSSELDRILPQRNPSVLKEVLAWDPEVLRGLNAEQRIILEDLYRPWPACAELIQSMGHSCG